MTEPSFIPPEWDTLIRDVIASDTVFTHTITPDPDLIRKHLPWRMRAVATIRIASQGLRQRVALRIAPWLHDPYHCDD